MSTWSQFKNAFTKKGLSNAYNRASSVIGGGSGAAYSPGKWWEASKAFLTPQSAMASDSNADWLTQRREELNTEFGPSATEPQQPATDYSQIFQNGQNTQNTQNTGTVTQTPATPSYAWWLGKKYNWDNPDERNSYADARKAYIESQFGTDFANQERSYLNQTNDYNTSLENLKKNQEWWNQDYTKQLEGLGRQNENANVRTGNWYSKIAPNSYQSAEQATLDENQRVYNEGLSTAQRAKEQADSSFTQNKSNLDRNNEDLNIWWRQTQAKQNDAKQQELDAINQQLDEAKAADAEMRIKNAAASAGFTRDNSYTPLERLSALDNFGAKFADPSSKAYSQAVQSGANRAGYTVTPEELKALPGAATAYRKYLNNLNSETATDPFSGLTADERAILASFGI